MPKHSKASNSNENDEPRPSAYQEAMEMLTGALVIYLVAELRDMVREDALPGVSLEQLEPPLTAQSMIQLVQENAEALKERAVDHEYLTSRLLALQQMQASSQKNGDASTSFLGSGLINFFKEAQSRYQLPSSSSREQLQQQQQLQKKHTSTTLTHFEDNNSKEEMVHALVVNPSRRRIAIVFRGSVTQKDFLQDAKCAQVKLDNPVYQLLSPEQQESRAMPSTMNLHTGFYEYLSLKNETTGKTRLETVLDQAREQLRAHPGYSLFCTGHSLGGALATLVGFFAACDPELLSLAANNRVVVYSIASPFCGNWKFRQAFEELERQRKLQHLRMANQEDMVTLLPFAVPKATFLSPAVSMFRGAGNLYKHVGIKFQMKQIILATTMPADEKEEEDEANQYQHQISYPKERQHVDSEDNPEYAKEIQQAMESGKSLVKAFYHMCKNDFVTVEKYHSCDEYELRLEACQKGLRHCTLDDLYNDTKIVGKLFADDYKPSLMTSGVSRTFKAFSVLRSHKRKNAKIGKQENPDQEVLTLSEAAHAK